MNGGIRMSNLNGMGPNNDGPMTRRGLGKCVTKTSTINKIRPGMGIGTGLRLGLRRGMNQGGRGRGRCGFFGICAVIIIALITKRW